MELVEVVDVAAYVTALVAALGAAIASVFGFALAFVVLRRALDWVRGVDDYDAQEAWEDAQADKYGTWSPGTWFDEHPEDFD